MVKEVTVTKFEAFDGTVHETKADALAHEEANFEGILTELTIEQVRAAITRQPEAEAISEALEKAGNLIAKARRDAGELKRRPNKAKEEPATPPDAAEPTAEPDAEAAARQALTVDLPEPDDEAA